MRTAEEISADITAVSAARMNLLLGKSFTSLEIGSDAMRRKYTYGAVSINDLNAAIKLLQEELANLLQPASPFMDTAQFRAASMPLIYNKGL
jgi:hypothetical protein